MQPFNEQYSILFKCLKTGLHNFDFELDDRFFEYFENSDCLGGTFRINAELDKKDHLLSLCFSFSGSTMVICDRCLEELDIPLEFKSNLFVKFGPEEQETDADVIYLEQNEHILYLADYFMESIFLHLPIKRVHHKDAKGNDICNKSMIEKLNEHRSVEDNAETDPRWDSLKNLISNQN